MTDQQTLARKARKEHDLEETNEKHHKCHKSIIFGSTLRKYKALSMGMASSYVPYPVWGCPIFCIGVPRPNSVRAGRISVLTSPPML